jgi:hypothetical protein
MRTATAVIAVALAVYAAIAIEQLAARYAPRDTHWLFLVSIIGQGLLTLAVIALALFVITRAYDDE